MSRKEMRRASPDLSTVTWRGGRGAQGRDMYEWDREEVEERGERQGMECN